ncbi:MAG: hypothetical protein GEU93_06515 [Propionibacteriales bacterium]|nr:hypothetical protein [Propionibacteriales bacterium]
MDNIADGLDLLLGLQPLTYLVFGVLMGFIAGVLPGFSGSNAAAIVLSFSIGLSLESALLLMAGIYAGASFAGSVPAILMNVPGTAGAAATALDGYPLANERGRPGFAIGLARMASAIGGVFGAVVVLVLIGPMSALALSFGARELFVVALAGLAIISVVVGPDVPKGLASGLLGLLIAAMSANTITAQPRFTFGFVELFESIPFIPALIGLFAISEMLLLSRRHRLVDGDQGRQKPAGTIRSPESRGEIWAGVATPFRYPATLLRSSSLGLLFGIIPGVGSAVANFVSYGLAKRASTTPEEFGRGTPEGVVASESSDNALTAGTLVPTMTLGIPGSGTAAVMLAALLLHGVQPGPTVMTSHAAEVYAVILGLLVASIIILPLGLLFTAPLMYVTRLQPDVLVPVVLVVSLAGAFAVRNSMFDVMVALVFGFVGFALRLAGYPVVPMVLGLILGPIAESNLLRALRLGQGDVGYLFGSATAVLLWSILVGAIVYGVVKTYQNRRADERSGMR